uniref:Protein LLP homolog n=2 Tax=Ixodes ricinus TaxID=34613 RepID=A0A147BHN7_IXORI
MAKSLRSKWKRKMRAKKRERYSVKELARLKTMLEAATKGDADMSEVCEMVDAKKVAERASQETTEPESDEEGAAATMDVDAPKKRKYRRKTMTDEHGTHPEWMNQRAIRKFKANRQNRKGRGLTKSGKKKEDKENVERVLLLKERRVIWHCTGGLNSASN